MTYLIGEMLVWLIAAGLIGLFTGFLLWRLGRKPPLPATHDGGTNTSARTKPARSEVASTEPSDHDETNDLRAQVKRLTDERTGLENQLALATSRLSERSTEND
jgi:hypothetical protein